MAATWSPARATGTTMATTCPPAGTTGTARTTRTTGTAGTAGAAGAALGISRKRCCGNKQPHKKRH
ncbi:hypothetical protein GCM10022398_18840 [Acetobacter lovaniensis]|nr:hypothetical protein AA0474_2855 [Acetobacter lovaniensis NRIC 0474]